MTKMRIALAVAIGVVAVVGAFASGTSETNTQPVTIYFWNTEPTGDRHQGMENIVAKFEQMYPNVKVVQNSLDSTPYLTALRTALFGGGTVDVFKSWAGSRASEIASAGLAADLDSFWKDNQFDTVYNAGVKDVLTYGGKTYYVPFLYRYNPLLWYMPSTLKKYGITSQPKNWAEFDAMLKTLKSNGVYPFALGNKGGGWLAPYLFEPLLIRTGGMTFYKDLISGKVPFTDARVLKAFEIWKQWADNGYFFPDANAYTWTDIEPYWQKEQAAFIPMNDAALSNFHGLNVDVSYMRFPQYSSDVPIGDTMQLYVFGAAANSKHMKESMNLLKLIASVDGQEAYMKASPSLMINPNIPTSMYTDPLQLQLSKDFNATAMSLPIDMGPPQEVGQTFEQALEGWFSSPTMETARAILEKTQATYQSILKKGSN